MFSPWVRTSPVKRNGFLSSSRCIFSKLPMSLSVSKLSPNDVCLLDSATKEVKVYGSHPGPWLAPIFLLGPHSPLPTDGCQDPHLTAASHAYRPEAQHWHGTAGERQTPGHQPRGYWLGLPGLGMDTHPGQCLRGQVEGLSKSMPYFTAAFPGNSNHLPKLHPGPSFWRCPSFSYRATSPANNNTNSGLNVAAAVWRL